MLDRPCAIVLQLLILRVKPIVWAECCREESLLDRQQSINIAMMNPEEWIKGSDRDMRHVAVKGDAKVIWETSRVYVEVVVNPSRECSPCFSGSEDRYESRMRRNWRRNQL